MPAGNATACLVLGSECNPTAVGRLLRCCPLLAETAANVFRGLRRSVVDPLPTFGFAESCHPRMGATSPCGQHGPSKAQTELERPGGQRAVRPPPSRSVRQWLTVATTFRLYVTSRVKKKLGLSEWMWTICAPGLSAFTCP